MNGVMKRSVVGLLLIAICWLCSITSNGKLVLVPVGELQVAKKANAELIGLSYANAYRVHYVH
jgi:hypothetical protein